MHSQPCHFSTVLFDKKSLISLSLIDMYHFYILELKSIQMCHNRPLNKIPLVQFLYIIISICIVKILLFSPSPQFTKTIRTGLTVRYVSLQTVLFFSSRSNMFVQSKKKYLPEIKSFGFAINAI